MERRRANQDIIIFALFYILILFIFENCQTRAASLPADGETEGIHIQKTVRRRTLTEETKSKYLKNLAEGFYRYRVKGKVFSHLLSKSWGVGGMPFNVLYTPNIRQQKILKSVPKGKSEVRRRIVNGANLVGKPPPETLPRKETMLKKTSAPRKYYSFIPHFFVSYGW